MVSRIDDIAYKNTTKNITSIEPFAVHTKGQNPLKKIDAIVRRENFPDIDNALKEAGISGLTFFDAEGRGRSKGREMVAGRGTKTYQSEYVERTKLEIIVKDSDAKKVVDIILAKARTRNIGDGKVFVSTVEEGYDISSGTSGESSIDPMELHTYAVKPTK